MTKCTGPHGPLLSADGRLAGEIYQRRLQRLFFFLLCEMCSVLRRTRQGFASPRNKHAPLTEPAQHTEGFPCQQKEKIVDIGVASHGRARCTWHVHRSGAQTLEGRRSGGYARERAGTLVLPLILYFQCVYAAVVSRIRFAARSEWNLPILTYSQHVTVCYRVNATFFADAGRAPLIPNTFTRVNARYLYSYPAGDDVSQRQQPVRKHRVLLRAVPTNLEEHDVDRTATGKM